MQKATNSKISLILVSFVSLFLELVVIRWLASEVRIFAYFKNLPLFAAFLGLGAGFIIAPSRKNYFRFMPVFLFLLVLVIGFASKLGYTHVVFIDPFEHYLLGEWHNVGAGSMLTGLGLLAGIFTLVVVVFTGIGEKVGELLNDSSPLSAYSLNIAAGLAGVLAFTLLSFLQTGPAIWVLVAILPLIPFFRHSFYLLPLLASWFVILWMPAATTWSPYYRIDLKPNTVAAENGSQIPLGYTVNVNHDGILGAYDQSQQFVNQLSEKSKYQLLDYYNVPYRVLGQRFRKVLVLGAGGGNDVAAALRNGARHVDAVEIDPAILDIGRKYHPEKPYSSDLVRPIVADARAFLRDDRNSGYDLIVLGELDSHTVFSSMSSIRLDNYVYTVESFREALRRLKPDGVLALSFYYYKDWQMARVFDALWRANGSEPVAVHSLGQYSDNLVLFAGPGAPRAQLLRNPYVLAHSAANMVGNGTMEPTTDDWPFLYLKQRGLPSGYFSMLIVVLGIAYMVSMRGSQLSSAATDWAMFFFGVGFMLLETKVMAKIALLVGATWVVNTFVIGAVLLMILGANYVAVQFSRISLQIVFAAILASITFDWLFKIGTRSFVPSPTADLLIALGVLVLPIFFAAIAFAKVLKGREATSIALGYNLFGAMVGGVLEYLSTIWGINSLNGLCIAAYVCTALSSGAIGNARSRTEVPVSEKLTTS